MELLKLRFGEAPMHFCEVMLKDMADSRRINANIREEDEKRPVEEQPPFGVYAVILSSEFWPPSRRRSWRSLRTSGQPWRSTARSMRS